MQEAWIDSEGARLWACSEGTGSAVVFCNGGPGCGDYLAPVAAMLQGAAQTIRFEHRGCGRSEPAPAYSLSTCLADLEAVRRHFDIERWIVVGHSFGADLALVYALEYPQHALAIACLAGGRVHNDREWHRVYREKRDLGLEPPLPEELAANRTVNFEVNQDWKRYIQQPSLLAALARMPTPGLFVYGDRDIRPSWPVEQVAALLPRARFERVDGAGHHLWLTHAEQLKARLTGFVRDVAGGEQERSGS
jgi:proline iminopeptidase